MQLDQLAKQAVELWKRLGFGKRAVLVAVLAMALAGALAAGLYEPEVSYAVLFSDLPEEEAGPVVEELTTTKVQYRLQNQDGRVSILVPAEQASKLRVALASKDLPGSKAGLETFGDGAYGVPESVGRVKYNWALSQELARTIRGLDAVREARVHLAMPPKSIYKKLELAPSASVTVHLKPGHTLSTAEVRGVVNLVARSVEGLTPAGVTLVDRSGKELWAGGDDGHASMMQRELEREREAKIEALLERVLGPDQYEVVVTVQLDRSRVRRTEEHYDKDKPSVLSEEIREERRSPVVVQGGITGARANLPTPGAVGAQTSSTPGTEGQAAEGAGGPGTWHSSRNYLVDRVVTNTEQPDTRLAGIHVAVLVNAPEPVVQSSTVSTSSRAARFDGVVLGPGRDAPDLGKLAGMIKAAGGLDMARGDTLELATMPFYVDPEAGPRPEAAQAALPPPWYETMPLWAYGVAAGSILLLVLAALMTVVRARRQAAVEEAELVAYPARADELEAVLEGSEYEPAPTLAELRVKVHELMLTNGDLAAEILAAWIDDQQTAGGSV